MNKLSTTYLPDGREVFCLQAEEAKVLYEQVRGYIKHDLTLKEGDTVFDVGANIGLFSLMVDDLCWGQANIFAFEPIPDVFAALNRNAAKFNPAQIKTFQIALGDRSHITNFSYYPNATAISSLYPDASGREKQQFATTVRENAARLPFPINLIDGLPEPLRSFSCDRIVDFAYWEEKIECQIKTISQIIVEQSIAEINLLKIDVEKAELDVLLGIESQHWSIIQQVVIEVHDLDGRVDRITDLLYANGFKNVVREQDPIFKHLNIYSIFATK